MMCFVQNEDRRQGVLLPEYLDDYVGEDNPVRVIDVFVDELDLGAPGFDGVIPEATGRAHRRDCTPGGHDPVSICFLPAAFCRASSQ
jgi:hypothetical protein